MSTISFAGRLELINVVVQGIEGFWMHAFPMPKTILERINKLGREYLWAGGHAKVAWKDVCMPKAEGGLGLRNNKVWNDAIMLKLLWDIHANKDSLWIKWVHGFYLRRRNVWLWRCSQADPPLFKKL